MRKRASGVVHQALVMSVILASIGCGGGLGRLQQTSRLPPLQADQTAPPNEYPPAAALDLIVMSAEEYAEIEAEKLAPLCDARSGSVVTDAARLAQVQEAFSDAWKVLDETQRKIADSPTGLGKAALFTVGTLLPSDSVESVSLDCSRPSILLVINGNGFVADVVWGHGEQDKAALVGLSLQTGLIVGAIVREPNSSFILADAKQYLPPQPGEIAAHPFARFTAIEVLVSEQGQRRGILLAGPNGSLGSRDGWGVARFEVR